MASPKEEKQLLVCENDTPHHSTEESQTPRKTVVKVKSEHELYPIKVLKYEPLIRRGLVKNTTISFTDIFVVLTPINMICPETENGVQAKNDYMVEEKKFFDGDEFPKWDDPARAKARPGDIFAFCHNQVSKGVDLAEFFYVTGKQSKEHRPSNWLIAAHSDRDVIVLSRYVGYTTVTDVFIALGSRPSHDEGTNCLRGTVRRKLKLPLVVWREH